MAWAESDRVQIRAYLGWTNVQVQGDLRLENALSLVQSVADGGQRPDSSAETEIRSYMAEIVLIDAAIKNQRSKLIANEIGTLKVNALQAQQGLRREGRDWIARMSAALSICPLYDYFGGRAPVSDESRQTWYGSR